MIFRFLTGPQRHAAVLNAMLAKLTLPTLDELIANSVQQRGRSIYGAKGRAQPVTADQVAETTLDHMSEFERCTLYSMAMMELLIQPSINEEWSPPPRNPFMMRISDRDVAVQAHYLKRRHGINVTLGVTVPGFGLVEPETIPWCGTCRHRRRERVWHRDLEYLSEDMPSTDLLPCKIVDQTLEVWERFFRTEWRRRVLYPKNCPKWKAK